ncbi:MAG: BTAD domain-containing putative transcriptional regulator [Acidimicrobiales bacterium]
MVDNDVLDVARYEQLLRRADAISARRAAEAAVLYEQALSLWRDPPFNALSDSIDVLAIEAARLVELRIDALERRSACLLRAGSDPARLAAELSAHTAAFPYREGLWAGLITALYRAGRQAEALDAYQRLRRALAEDLGISPSPQLAALEAAVLRHDPSLSGSTEVEAAASHSGADGFVPRPLDRCFGRELELASLPDLLATERLITLTGPGGGGKSRLAIELALAEGHRFDAGAWFCELAPVPDALSVGYAVAERIGVKQAPGQSIIESLADWAAPRRLLIVLDNCEHVRIGVRALVAALLPRCPHLAVVATSREPLGLPGERVWRLGPLRTGAAALFEDRAACAGLSGPSSGDRRTIEAICERLDRLPLAIELAAARCRFLSPAEVLERLDRQMDLLRDHLRSADERHTTMRAAIAWSYDTLDPHHQGLFRAASVFRGGFTLEAIAAVTASDVLDASDAVETLVHRSLISVEPHENGSRYRMLEPLRQFAADLLDDVASTVLQRRHAAFFMGVAHEIGVGYESADHQPALASFEAEFANLRAAQQHLVSVGALDEASSIVGGVGEIAAYRMQFEVLAWFDAEQAVRAAAGPTPCDDVDHLPLTALFEAGRLATVIALAERVLATPSAKPRTQVLARIVCAWSYANSGRLDEVRDLIDDAVRSAQAEGLRYWAIEAGASRSQIAARVGAHPDFARAEGARAIVLAEEFGNVSQRTLAYALSHHAAVDHADRLELLRLGLEDGKASGNLLMTAVCAYQLGDHTAREGSLVEAAGPFLLALEQFSRGRVLTQLWNVLEIIAQRWADHDRFELPLLIWGAATARQVRPITTSLPTTPTARERTSIIAAAQARRDRWFSRGEQLSLDQLVAEVSRELSELASHAAAPDAVHRSGRPEPAA